MSRRGYLRFIAPNATLLGTALLAVAALPGAVTEASAQAASDGAVRSASFSTVAGTATRADVVVRNARVYTVDTARSWADALAIAGARLVFVGAESDVDAWIGPDTRVIDAGGRLILPAFHDTHTHLGHDADMADWCDAGYPDTLEDTVRALARCSADAAGRDWVLVHGGNETVVPAAGPPFDLLDSIEPDRPMLYQMAGGHEAWVNGVVLRLMGVDASTPDPDGGAFVRDAAGRLTGSVRGAAMPLAYAHVPWPDEQEAAARHRDWLTRLPSHGIASIQEITELFDEWALVLEDWPDAGVRVRLAQRLTGYGEQGTRPEERVAEAAARAEQLASPQLSAGAVKLFVDGTFGAQTAALHAPYLLAERPGWRGEPYFTQDELNDWAQHVDAAGLQLHFHAIGDRAVHMALNAIEHAQQANGRRDARHQISHLHLTATADLHRFRELGVIANVQPYFADDGPYNTQRALGVLGPERNALMHRFRDLLDSGAVLVASTDAPISPWSPLETIHVAVNRREVGSDSPPFNFEQRLTLPEVIAAYTINGAYANFMDRDSGSLEVGKRADFVMLDRNLFDIDPGEIHAVRILWTMLDGREAFRSAEW